MKIGIIGGGGRVGSNAAYALQTTGTGSEIVLLDANREAADGEALDLRHGSAMSSSQRIRSGDYADLEGAECVVITAGLRRKPDESRLELINRNVDLFRSVLASLKPVRLADDCVILVVSNPVDVLTYLAVKESGLPSQRVIGLGTVLDTCRFRSLLAEKFAVGATDVEALILGEHGDSMVPIWSSATIGGASIKSFQGASMDDLNAIFDYTKKGGAEVIRLKGGAGYAVGISIQQVVRAIESDSQAILPISALQNGALGIRDVCLSLPTTVGRKGVVAIHEPSVDDNERSLLLKSSEALSETNRQVMG